MVGTRMKDASLWGTASVLHNHLEIYESLKSDQAVEGAVLVAGFYIKRIRKLETFFKTRSTGPG